MVLVSLIHVLTINIILIEFFLLLFQVSYIQNNITSKSQWYFFVLPPLDLLKYLKILKVNPIMPKGKYTIYMYSTQKLINEYIYSRIWMTYLYFLVS